MSNTFLEEYNYLIKGRHIVVNRWIKAEVDNLIRDLQDGRYIYDTTEAHKRFKFQEKLCLQSKAPYYNQPIVLMPWQKAFWEPLYSFKMADTGYRRFTEALLKVARKNGKSTMFAADGNTDLFIGDGGEDICCASNDDRQARLIWSEIGGMRSRIDPKRLITGQTLTEIRNKYKNITIFRLSSKTQNKDGFNISKVYLDESHDMEDDEIAEACWRGMSSKEQPLFLNCTTEGFVADGYLDKKDEYAKRVILGEIDDIHFMPFIYEQDSEQEVWQDPSSWEKSNPSIRYGVKKTAKLLRDLEVAKYDKGARIHMLCKDFNIKQNAAESWLLDEDYRYIQDKKELENFRGCYCIGAVDLSETTDLTNAKILIMRPNDKTKYIFSKYLIPESKVKQSPDINAGADYKEWARAGYIEVCEDNENDLTLVADWFYWLYKEYDIKLLTCGYDVKFSKDFINRMNDYNFETELIQQTTSVMSTPMKWVEADLKSKLINYGNNPVDAWCLGNASIKVDDLGRVMCVKMKNQPQRRIDGAVTLIILYATYQRVRKEYTELINR